MGMRWFLCGIGSLVTLLGLTLPSLSADLWSMPRQEIMALQRRLADAACYAGLIDGRPSPDVVMAVAACPTQKPQLRIETGMHVATIREIGVDADCRIIATGSDDKTVRLWTPEGQLIRTLRWPIGPGAGGQVFAVALSPDGRTVAVAGYDANYDAIRSNYISIFEVASGALLKRVGGYEHVIAGLAFSKDGRWLAATQNAGAGLRVLDVTNGRTVAIDKDYADNSYAVTFGPDGRLFVTGYDGRLRRYGPGPEFRKEIEVKTRGGHLAFSVALDPSGSRLAVAFVDVMGVDLYDASSLTFLAGADTTALNNGDLTALSWSQDGTRLIAAGTYASGGRRRAVLFDRDGKAIGAAGSLGSDAVRDFRPCGPGFVFATADPSFGMLDRDGMVRMKRNGVMVDMRLKLGRAFTVSADARRVRFGLDLGGANAVQFDLVKTTLSDATDDSIDFLAPLTTGVPLAQWENRLDPTVAGKRLKLLDHEVARSAAVQPDASGFVLGTDFKLRTFDSTGEQRWLVDAPGGTLGINLSADGRLIVAGYADGTIRWYRWSDGEELLALFVNAQTKAWVAWMPSGYYAASPGAEDMIGWQVNRGWTQAADFFPASRFHDIFARPDVVEHALDDPNGAEPLPKSDSSRPARIKPNPAPLIERLPPVISIVSPADGATVSGAVIQIDYTVRSPSGLTLDGVDALIDGRPAEGVRGLAPLDDLVRCLGVTLKPPGGEDGSQGCQGSLTLTLPPGMSNIGLVARAGGKTSEVAAVRLTRHETALAAETLKPKLYALVVGISSYANQDYLLGYPAKDAHDFAAALSNQKGGLYSEVVVRMLTDGDARATAIKDGFDWLDKQVTSRDVGVVFMAGHGTLDERERFYFLAADSDANRLRATAVSRDDIADGLDGIAGKAMLFLDACHAGAVGTSPGRRSTLDVNRVVNDLAQSERGTVIFAASTGRQVSIENESWGNGAFTKAVVEGLGRAGIKGEADFQGDGRITTSELDAYVTDRVKTLTGGAQSPVMIRPSTVPDFPFALAR